MSDNEAYLLVLEDNDIVSGHLERWMKFKFPQKQVVIARTIAEAQAIVAEYPIDFFILDIHLPDGNGIDFLCDLKMVVPSLRVIVMTASPIPEYRTQAAALGSIRFFEKPIDLKHLEKELREHLTCPSEASNEAAVAADAPQGVHAILQNLTLVDIVQLKCLSRCSAGLEFARPNGQRGRIYFRNGEVIHADAGQLQGVDAFNLILSWAHGNVHEVPPPPGERQATIDQSWQMLLMEATQAIDEGRIANYQP